ncbi:hypothetical protein RFI_10242 [Reticulomyxa filosa]|uniref:Uncharacterized protein n=1 Tax=Reticulomyxa filosa TaxID=46433 RepID=X6NNF6_RETFI|nr:hypothetical protein RFI_10242 [Reticulomyxa filosa]|eukprot:ETO26892.1 hypothetical protein RFI_10242 [Reticulomyxa filosa]
MQLLPCHGRVPCPRSQHYSFITGDLMFVFGGCYATSTLNDLHVLDLNTYVWSRIDYGLSPWQSNVPNSIFRIVPANFRVCPVRLPCYFDPFQKCLYVLFGVELSLMKPDVKEKVSQTVYRYHLLQNRWEQIPACKTDHSNPPPDYIQGTRVIRVGSLLVQVGGTFAKGSKELGIAFALKIPDVHIPWSIERLVWIGVNKNESNKLCPWARIPIVMVQYILSFLKS